MSRMGESYAPGALPQSCLSHALRTQLAQVAETSHSSYSRVASVLCTTDEKIQTQIMSDVITQKIKKKDIPALHNDANQYPHPNAMLKKILPKENYWLPRDYSQLAGANVK